ncbi:MAG: HemK/PrmC family methyltransferase [Microgenomates group bacterium]
MAHRIFTPYELNQLARATIDSRSIMESDTRPVEYITGVVDFCGSQFICTPNTLIPRIETEELVALVVDHCKLKIGSETLSILDVGTGTGAIGISIAMLLPSAQVRLALADISENALSIAKQNKDRILAPEYAVTFHLSDLFENIPKQEFKVIVANLPYIFTDEMATLPDSVKNHEPHAALDGGRQGNLLYHRFLDTVLAYSHPETAIFFEINERHTIEDIVCQRHAKYWTADLIQDSFQKNRFLILKKK